MRVWECVVCGVVSTIRVMRVWECVIYVVVPTIMVMRVWECVDVGAGVGVCGLWSCAYYKGDEGVGVCRCRCGCGSVWFVELCLL